jgi:hypothetical protein
MSWCESKSLPLNISKCNSMSFSPKMQPVMFKYTINSVILDRPDIIRDLGVSFDPKLSFVHHINATVNKCSRALGFVIRNSKEFTKSKISITLFLTFMRSKLDYAMIIWVPYQAVHIATIARVQRRFLK